MARDGQAYPDTVVGTDSHTTMVNGLGVLGWGVGGIEAEAAMLGQPVSMLIPRVVGFKLTGELPDGATATDLVLTITEMLRKHGVVGKFVEFYGDGVAAVPLANRATIGNMSPEFGSTCAIFPIDDETIELPEADRPRRGSRSRSSRRTPRSRASGTTRPPSRPTPSTSSWTCPRSCRRSPARSARRTGSSLADAKTAFRAVAAATTSTTTAWTRTARGVASRPPTRRPPTTRANGSGRTSPTAGHRSADGTTFEIDHGAVVDRRDHLLHQHLQPAGHDRRRAAGQEGGRARA